MDHLEERHALEHPWSFYFDEKVRGGLEKLSARGSPEGEKENSPCSPCSAGSGGGHAQLVGTFATVQDFWCYWNNIQISKLPDNSNIRILKSNLSPSTEDICGKWIVACEKDQLEQKWLLCVLALIGGHFDDEIPGTLLSIGRRSSTITVWTKSTDKQVLSKSESYLTELLSLSKDKVRFQRQNGSELKVKTFSIKLSRSNLSSPISLPSLDTITPLRLSFGGGTEEDFSPAKGCMNKLSPVSSPSRLNWKAREGQIQSPTKSSPPPVVVSLSPAPVMITFTPPSPNTPPSAEPDPERSPSRLQYTPKNLSLSMDAVSERQPYSLPKFYRRRGRNSSRSLSSSPNAQHLSLVMNSSREEVSQSSPSLPNFEEVPTEEGGEKTPSHASQHQQIVTETEPEAEAEAETESENEIEVEVEVVSHKPLSEATYIPRDIKPVTGTKSLSRSINTSMGPVATTGHDSWSTIWMLLLGASAFLMVVLVYGVIPSIRMKGS